MGGLRVFGVPIDDASVELLERAERQLQGPRLRRPQEDELLKYVCAALDLVCRHCRLRKKDHAGAKCLFGPTRYMPLCVGDGPFDQEWI